MEKKPLFFRDEGDMGDVLSQARCVVKKVHLINKDLDARIKETDDLKEQVEEESYGKVIRESLSQEIQNISNLEQMVTEKINHLENTRQAIDNILNENKETINGE